jgi:hypothetical protein
VPRRGLAALLPWESAAGNASLHTEARIQLPTLTALQDRTVQLKVYLKSPKQYGFRSKQHSKAYNLTKPIFDAQNRKREAIPKSSTQAMRLNRRCFLTKLIGSGLVSHALRSGDRSLGEGRPTALWVWRRTLPFCKRGGREYRKRTPDCDP